MQPYGYGLVKRKGKENSGMGEMDVYLYVPNIKTPTGQIHADT